MKVVIIAYLLLLSPILAMEMKSDATLGKLYCDRIQEGEKRIAKLFQETIETLGGKEDVIASVNNQIREKRSRLTAPSIFLKELDALLRLLPHHLEELLTEEQRRALIGFPALEHLQPITNVIGLLGNFIKKWRSLKDYAKNLQVFANQTIWYHPDWKNLITQMNDKPICKKIAIEDLLSLYKYTSYFHAEATHLATSQANLQHTLQEMADSVPKDLGYLDNMFHKVTSFSRTRGSILWEIIRYSKLVTDTEEAKTLAKDYGELPDDFFLSKDNFVKKIFEEANPLTPTKKHITEYWVLRQKFPLDTVKECILLQYRSSKDIPISMPLQQSRPSSISRPVHSLPTPLQNSPLKITQTRSAPQTRSSSPVPQRAKAATPEEHFKKRLHEAFTRPIQWDEGVKSFNENVILLIQANFIVDPLCELLTYYKTFKDDYLSNHSSAYDLLTSKALLNIYNHPSQLISQTLARRASRLKTNGPLCFNMPDTSNINRIASQEVENECAETHGWNTPMNSSLFFRNLPSDVPNDKIGTEYAMSYLERLFGIYSEPVVPMIIENIRFFESKMPHPLEQRQSGSLVTETMHATIAKKFMEDPSAWVEQSRYSLPTAHRTFNGITLGTFLERVTLGLDSFDRLNRFSFGLEFLFSIVTQSTRPLENYGLVERSDGLLDLKRTGPSDLMAPIFQKIEESQPSFIGKNILYFLPLITEEIPSELVKYFSTESRIFFILASWVTELTKFQSYFDSIINHYHLDSNHEISQDLKTNLTKAQMLGLTTLIRPKTISQMIDNFLLMTKLLKRPHITYTELHEAIRPLEAQCIQLIQEKASRKINENSLAILFNDIIPLRITQLCEAHSQSQVLGGHTPYSLEELTSFRQTAKNCFSKYVEFDSHEDRAITFDNFISIISRNKHSNALSFFQESLKASSQWAIEKTETILFFEKVIPSLINQLIQAQTLWSSIGECPLYSLGDLTSFTKQTKECLTQAKISTHTSFDELISLLPDPAKNFFKKKHTWWKINQKTPLAQMILKAWGVTTCDHSDNSFENLKLQSLGSFDSNFWGKVSIRTRIEQSSYCQIIECSSSLNHTVKDLIKDANISSLPLPVALELLDRLLILIPNPKKYHESWKGILSIAKEEFLGMTPHVRSFLHSLGLQPTEEASVLQKAQLKKFENYRKIGAPNPYQEPPLAQLAGDLLRQLMRGSLELDQGENQLFFDGIIKFFTLPSSNSQSLAGLAMNPESKGGIFDLRYKVGDHYLLVKSPEWIKLFNSSHTLPNEMRLNFLNQPRHLLLLQWLDTLKKFYPNVQFHAWYPKTVIKKMACLQSLLSTSTSFTFNDIMAYVWLEFYFATEQCLNHHENDANRALKSQEGDNHKLTPIDDKADLDYRKNDKNILTLLGEWDVEHQYCLAAQPLSLDDVATEWLADLNPMDYGPMVLTHILELAMHFKVDSQKIDPALWGKPEILVNLVSANAPLQCLQLVASFRAKLPFKDIILKKSDSSWRISGFKGKEDAKLIEDLIPLFPDVTALFLDDNGLRSLKPLVSSLKKLPSLTKLSFKNNPIHNPAPLVDLPQLTSLNIENTGIPAISPGNLQEFIAKEMQIKVEEVTSIKKTLTLRFSALNKRADNLLRKSPPGLLRVIRDYTNTSLSLEDMENLIYILEGLGEELWLHTLALQRSELNISCDFLFNKLFQEFDPRGIVYRLLFAIKFTLPHGTNPDTLSFVNNIPSMQANCLNRLDVTKACVSPQFIQSLFQFENLSHLSLIDIGLINLDDFPILRQLRILDLRNNKITTLKGLHTNAHDIKFPALNILNLANNKICTDIGINFLLELAKLTYLNLGSNELTQMPSLRNLRNLKKLDLRNNRIPPNQLNDCQ